MLFLTLFAVTFAGVAVRAFQNINVTHGHYWRIPLASYLYAISDLGIFANVYVVVTQELNVYFAVLAMGTGGWTGCFFSMCLSNYMNRRKAQCPLPT